MATNNRDVATGAHDINRADRDDPTAEPNTAMTGDVPVGVDPEGDDEGIRSEAKNKIVSGNNAIDDQRMAETQNNPPEVPMPLNSGDEWTRPDEGPRSGAGERNEDGSVKTPAEVRGDRQPTPEQLAAYPVDPHEPMRPNEPQGQPH